MNLFLGILLIILAFFGGMIAGMFLLRRQFEKEFASNPRRSSPHTFRCQWPTSKRSKSSTSLSPNCDSTKISNGEKQEKIRVGQSHDNK